MTIRHLGPCDYILEATIYLNLRGSDLFSLFRFSVFNLVDFNEIIIIFINFLKEILKKKLFSQN